MINLRQDQKERCKVDPQYLRETLEDELARVHNLLESTPLDKIQALQGRCAALKDIINLLP